MNDIEPSRLHQILDYNPETGVFTRKVSDGNAHVGDVAGGIGSTGYWEMSVLGHKCRGHRVAWAMVTGQWPNAEIDHINGVRSDNRLANLRAVSTRENAQNKCGRVGASGLRGVWFHKKNQNWVAAIKINKRAIHLGSFATPDEAHQAYIEAKAKLHPVANLNRMTPANERIAA